MECVSVRTNPLDLQELQNENCTMVCKPSLKNLGFFVFIMKLWISCCGYFLIVEKFLIVGISKEGIAFPGAEVGARQTLAGLCSWPHSFFFVSYFICSHK